MKRNHWAGAGWVDADFIWYPCIDHEDGWHDGIERFLNTCRTFYRCDPGRTQHADFLRDVHSGRYDEPGVPRRHLTSLALRMGQDHPEQRPIPDDATFIDDNSDTIIDMGD